jgi:hypothetical protein
MKNRKERVKSVSSRMTNSESLAMTAKFAKTLLIVMLLVAYVAARPVVCEAWSFWPFSSSDSKETKPSKPAPAAPANQPAQKSQPSTLSKMSSGTKSFFDKTGETLGLKKPEKKQAPSFAYAKPPVMQKKQPEKKSWFGSWFGTKEPEKKDKSVSDWIGSSKPITP